MYKIVVGLAAVSLLVGCASKEQKSFMKIYEKERSYHSSLQKTEKVQLYEDGVTKALFTATYINKQTINTKRKENEVFIVGIYIEESEDSFLDGVESYTLLLNGHKPKHMKPLKEGDALLKNISFVSQWSRFYKVTFPHESGKRLKLLFKSSCYGKGELYFAKVAKYVLSKKPY